MELGRLALRLGSGRLRRGIELQTSPKRVEMCVGKGQLPFDCLLCL